jgi:polygalacturonase
MLRRRLTRSLALGFAASVLLLGAAYAQPPEPPGSAVRPAPSDWGLPTPQPEPALPNEFDAFDPPPLSTGAAGPVIAEASQTAGPGESFVVSGVGLGPGPQFRIYAQRNAGDEAKLWWSNGAVASAVLPLTLGEWATYAVWPENAKGRGQPFFLNRTDLWWVGPSTAAPGAQAAIYGRNLSSNNASGRSWVYVKAEGQAPGQWAEVAGINPYKVDFVIPPNLGPGRYEVWAHNGRGGRFGWSGPVGLIISASPWTGQDARVLDVRSFGARGDGNTDDAGAIEAALGEAGRNAPATVYFPPGRYVVSHGFAPPARVRWLGAGRNATTIVSGPGFQGAKSDPRTYALLFAEGAANANGIEVANLTLDDSAHRGLLGRAIHIRFAESIAFRDVRVRSGPGDSFNFDGSRGVFLQRVELIGTGGFLGAASQVFIDDCDFLLTHNATTAILSWGGQDIAVIGNRVRDLDSTRPEGTGAGRFFVAQAHSGGTEHVYIAENTSQNLGPPSPAWKEFDQNSGEQILFEQCCATLTEHVAAASPDTVTPMSSKIERDGTGRYDVLVVAGRGLGQHRRIVSYDRVRRQATVSPPWLVVPDRTSTITVAGLAQQVAVYNNSLDGKAGYASASTASSGVRLYANSVDTVVAANRMTRVRGGVELWAMGSGPAPEMNSVFFNLVADNVVSDSYDGVSTWTKYLYAEMPGAVGHLGNVFRGNRGGRLAGAGIRITQWGSWETGAQLANVFEKSWYKNMRIGVTNDPKGPSNALTPLVGTILQGNTFERGSMPYLGSVAISWPDNTSWRGTGNNWQNFENTDGTRAKKRERRLTLSLQRGRRVCSRRDQLLHLRRKALANGPVPGDRKMCAVSEIACSVRHFLPFGR